MVVPESSHDRSCSKESPKNVPSTITIPESDIYKTMLFEVSDIIMSEKLLGFKELVDVMRE